MPYNFTPPTAAEVPVTEPGTNPLGNRLMSFFPARMRGLAIWKLPDGTYTFDQPITTIFPDLIAQGAAFAAVPNADIGISWSNLQAVTVELVYYGGVTYVVSDTEEAALATFLTAQGYTPSDWLVHI